MIERSVVTRPGHAKDLKDKSRGQAIWLPCMFFMLVNLVALGRPTGAAGPMLAWDPSPDPNVIGYKLYYGPAIGRYTNAIEVGNVTSTAVPGLSYGATFFFAVSAYTSLGIESDFSNEIRLSTTNAPPTLDPLPNLTIDEDSPGRLIPLSGISSGASNENQRLTVTATSSNPDVIPTPWVSYVNPQTNGALIFGAWPNASGSALITVTVNDGQPTNNLFSRSFVVTVRPVNDPPTISSIPNQRITQNTFTYPIPIVIGDVETPASNLVLSASSSNPALVVSNSIVFDGSGSNRTVTVTPVPGASGVAIITVSVSDGTAQVSAAFQLTVLQMLEVKILAAAPVLSSGFLVQWQSVPGRTYRVCVKDNLTDPHWSDLSSDIIALGYTSSWTDITLAQRQKRFYKVRLMD